MTTVEMLDQLAEFQAQRDLLELNKSELLNAVKVPEDVLSIQKWASLRRDDIDSQLWAMQRQINAEKEAVLADIVKPELPAEYVEAMAAYNAQIDDLNSQATSRAETERRRANEAKSNIDTELQSQTADIFAQVETRRREIADEFGSKAAAVDANIAKLTEEIKRATIAEGHSVKGKVFHAVYAQGRVTWNADRLDALAQVFPGIKEARKEGAPSVSIRKI